MSPTSWIGQAEPQHPIVKAVYAEIRRDIGLGMVPNLFQSMVVHPALLRAYWDVFRVTLLQGSVPRTVKEMLGVRIAHLHGNAYLACMHLHSLSVQGCAVELLCSLVHNIEQCPLPASHKAMIDFGVRVATTPQLVEDQDYAHLRAYQLSDAEIFELIAAADVCSLINAYTDSVALSIDLPERASALHSATIP